MSKTVEFYFDFGSPTTYLAWTQLPRLCAEEGATLVYKPMLLGGKPGIFFVLFFLAVVLYARQHQRLLCQDDGNKGRCQRPGCAPDPLQKTTSTTSIDSAKSFSQL